MNNGITLLIIAMCLTPCGDALSKYLLNAHSPFMVAFLRYLSGGLLAVGLARMLGQNVRIPSDAGPSQLLRALLLVASVLCLITAFSMVPLAYAVGGFLIAPLVAVVLSASLYNERLDGFRMAGIIASMFGAVIIAKPATSLEAGTLFALAGGVLLGTYLAFTRNSKQSGGALSTMIFQCFVGATVLAPFAFYSGLPQISGAFLAAVLGLGAFTAGAHLLTIAAYQRADAAVLSPFMYFNMIAAVISGLILFGEIPSLISTFGLIAIALGGLLSMYPDLRHSLIGRPVLQIPAQPAK